MTPAGTERARARSGEEAQPGEHGEDNLEPYRRLVELQKQMIELAQKHEQSRRECEALRTAVAKEMAACRHDPPEWEQRRSPAKDRRSWFNRKAPLPC